jgi:hypothetical protein
MDEALDQSFVVVGQYQTLEGLLIPRYLTDVIHI